MEEEADYMCDDFIKNCGEDKNDVRPGLHRNYREQRQHELIKKKYLAAEKNKKPTAPNEFEVLEKGLKQPITCINKGFSMLQKMGFKNGMGLGKNNSGIVEPITIQVKNNKQGLGHQSTQRTKVVKEKINEDNLNKLSENDFTALLSKNFRDKKIKSYLKRSQRICRELDWKFNKTKPDELWFWPSEDQVEEAETQSNMEHESTKIHLEELNDERKLDELTCEEKLDELIKYLRQNYHYCIWCKVHYEDEEDLQKCPGLTRDEH